MKHLFKCTKSTESSKGGFVNSIRTTIKTKVFGVTKTADAVFLLKTDEQIAEGTQCELNMEDFQQVPRQWVDDNGEIRVSTWLQLKVA